MARQARIAKYAAAHTASVYVGVQLHRDVRSEPQNRLDADLFSRDVLDVVEPLVGIEAPDLSS